MKRMPLIFVCSLFLVSGRVFCFDLKTDRGLALGGSSLLDRPTAADVVNLPGIWRGQGGALLSAGLQRRFNVRELDNGTLSAAFRRGQFSIGLGYQQLGRSEFYAERTIRLSPSCRFGVVSLSALYSMRSLDFGSTEYSSLSAGALGFSLAISDDRFIATFIGDNLNNPRYSEFSPDVERYLEAQFQPLGESILSVVARIRARDHQKPQFGLGQALELTDRFRLLWGLENRPLQYGAGFEIRLARVTIIYGGRFHGALGYTQQASVAYSFVRRDRRQK